MPDNSQGVLDQGYQVIFRGLNATPTGSTNTSVARFDSGVLNQSTGNIGVASWLLDTTTAVAGSDFKLGRRGIYEVEARLNLLASANLILALTIDTTQLAVAPTAGNLATRDFARVTAVAANLTTVLLRCPILVPQTMASDPDLGRVRLLITDEAGAAPPAAEISLADTMLRFTRVSDLRQRS